MNVKKAKMSILAENWDQNIKCIKDITKTENEIETNGIIRKR